MRPPNIVVVVLDCARSDDFVSAFGAAGEMPFLQSLRKQSEIYPRMTAVAPWTIPSHASLFTGLYPWEHRCHAKSNLRLRSEVPRLSSVLSSSGYRTFSLSANHLICPDLGFTDGFDHAAWAGWWEPYLRFGGIERPPNVAGVEDPGEAAPAMVERSGRLWNLVKRSSRVAYRYPFLLDGAGRFATAVRNPGTHAPAPVSGWIEPTLRRWLSRTPPDQPAFCFINLLETHEPYYPDSGFAPGLLSWWRYSRLRQDHVGWLAGDWDPTAAEMDRLHSLYRTTMRTADARLRSIVQVLQEAGRWDNTLLIVTSDHGQAFGEQQMLFHMLRLPESLVRVPMVIRRPGAESGGTVAQGWASLVDVAPTVLAAVGRQGAITTSGVAAESLLDAPRIGPVYSMADGLVWHTIIAEHEKASFSEKRKAEFDRILVCGHELDLKVQFDPTSGRTTAFDLGRDPLERSDLWATDPSRFEGLAESVRSLIGRINSAAPTEASADVEDRLRSWGYI
jgi:arylsulfatase A-like enzyme